MSKLRNYTVQSVHIECPYALAWEYLLEPMNQKEWGVHFYKDIRKVDGQYIASLPFGDVPMQLHSNADTGCIDLVFGGGEPVTSRLIKSSEASCVYVFVLFQPDNMPDVVWQQRGVPNMVAELQMLKQILEQKHLATAGY